MMNAPANFTPLTPTLDEIRAMLHIVHAIGPIPHEFRLNETTWKSKVKPAFVQHETARNGPELQFEVIGMKVIVDNALPMNEIEVRDTKGDLIKVIRLD